ncbi:MAG: hypothetical protein LV473_16630 [Nitrospira sp.]|nr:hypothetical protein [Nitrospira sp.]
MTRAADSIRRHLINRRSTHCSWSPLSDQRHAVLSRSTLTPKYRLIAIKPADPGLIVEIGLAWRRELTRPQVIDVIRGAVHALKVPGLKMVTERRT